MSMNPAAIMKMMQAKATFDRNHPKFGAFLKAVFQGGVEEGTVIEISVTKPGGQNMTTNFKVMQSDLDLLQELKNMSMNQN